MPPELREILVLAFMNPAALAVGFLLGRRADQIQKVVVIAFAAGLAGVLFAWVLMLAGLYPPHVRLLSGVFIASGVFGAVWAAIGFATRRPPAGDGPGQDGRR